MKPLLTTATSFVPSADDATEIQLRAASRAFHVAPKSVEV
jgi:hypothetical protein